MGSETAVIAENVPGGMSVVTTVIRTEFAQAIHKIVDWVATDRQAPRDVAREIQAALLHKLFHWMSRKGTHFLKTEETMERLERLAERLIDRALRQRAIERLQYGVDFLDDEDCRKILKESPHPRGRILVSTLVKVWFQLTFEERRVLQLVDLKYSLEDAALILDVSVNSAEFYLNQGNQKIHQAYLSLC